MQGLMNVVGATMRPQIYVFSSTVLILATEGAFFCALSHLISNFLSASIALTASTRPPFDLYIYALQEKWTVEPFFKNFLEDPGAQNATCIKIPHNFAVLQSSLISHQLISFNMIN